MAFYPCSFEGHYNPRRNYLAYVGLADGNNTKRWRLRLCATHIRDVQEYLSEFKIDPENGAVSGGSAAMTNCLSCGQPLDERGWQLFVTCYPPDDQREDYWARIHAACNVPTLIEDRWLSESA
jgi:hypothetical protein